MRDVVFLSHANPEDNLFTRWLALRLAAEGYLVWSDLTELLGGEWFWRDIETAIRERAAKVVFVVSRSSNHKRGPLRELQVAGNVERDETLKDFVIPALIDDLPPREMNIQLADRNGISFEKQWAAGLAALFAKLAKDAVPKASGAGPSAVSSWWQQAFGTGRGVQVRSEEYLSNRYRITSAPTQIFIHYCGPVDGDGPALWEFGFPVARVGTAFVSFAGPKQLSEKGLVVERSQAVVTETLRTAGLPDAGILADEGYRIVSQLFRVAWERHARAHGLRSHLMASRRTAWYFTKGTEKKRTLRFQGNDRKQHWRVVVGRYLGRWYHFAVSASVLFSPISVYAVQPHVVFSDDGVHPWDSPERLARARRSACKNWWNDAWRDRTTATIQFLADGVTAIRLGVAEAEEIVVDSSPERFSSPVSYSDKAFEELPTPEEASIDEDDEEVPE
ncbi:MAG: TIR domain-containing protein [Acidobacteria bacterium]|nr:MAG: TIR domain-containing protein [Acidobacteriota bacterium]